MMPTYCHRRVTHGLTAASPLHIPAPPPGAVTRCPLALHCVGRRLGTCVPPGSVQTHRSDPDSPAASVCPAPAPSPSPDLSGSSKYFPSLLFEASMGHGTSCTNHAGRQRGSQSERTGVSQTCRNPICTVFFLLLPPTPLPLHRVIFLANGIPRRSAAGP